MQEDQAPPRQWDTVHHEDLHLVQTEMGKETDCLESFLVCNEKSADETVSGG